jgi:NPCBM/NEW2 domain
MASHAKVSADSPAKAPADPEDKQERSLTRYATVVGIVTGLFGMSLGVGLILLPSATILERVLVIGACLAVSVAGLTGVGAWRSPRRFGLTMLASGLAIACLADLSITAAEKALGTSRSITEPRSRPSVTTSPIRSSASKKPGHPTTRTTPTSTASTSPVHKVAVVSPVSRSSPTTVYLSNLTWSADQVGEAPEPGRFTINGATYSQSIGYAPTAACTSPNEIIYDLGSNSYKSFLAEVGVADGYMPTDQTTVVGFTVYGKTSTGNFSKIISVAAQPRNPDQLNLPIPPGTVELELDTTLSDGCLHSAMVWGNARLTG